MVIGISICILLIVLLTYNGYRYVQVGTENFKAANLLTIRRKYVKENMDYFGIKNKNGVSLDKREIYRYTLDELGLNCPHATVIEKKVL